MAANNPLIKPSVKLVTSGGLISQLQFNEPSVAQKQVDAGGAYDIIGPATALTRVGYFASLRLANTDTSGHYVAFGDATLVAPSSISTGIWLAPNSVTYLSSGTNLYVRSDSALVQVCKLQDNLAAIQQSPTPPAFLPADTEEDEIDTVQVP